MKVRGVGQNIFVIILCLLVMGKSWAVSVADLFVMAENGQLEELMRFSNKVTLKARNGLGETLLIHAVLNSKSELVRYLADSRRSDLNARDQDGKTALFYAVSQDDSSSVDRLLEAGASADLVFGEHGENLMFEAVRSGTLEIIDLLLANRRDLASEANKQGRTPLEEAIFSSQTGAALYLMQHHQVALPTDTQKRKALMDALMRVSKAPAAREIAQRLRANP